MNLTLFVLKYTSVFREVHVPLLQILRFLAHMFVMWGPSGALRGPTSARLLPLLDADLYRARFAFSTPQRENQRSWLAEIFFLRSWGMPIVAPKEYNSSRLLVLKIQHVVPKQADGRRIRTLQVL